MSVNQQPYYHISVRTFKASQAALHWMNSPHLYSAVAKCNFQRGAMKQACD